MIYVIATIEAHPGQAAALIAGARPCIEATRREAGCISYEYVQHTEKPDVVMVIERWASREELGVHLQAPHLAEWRQLRRPWVKSTKVEIITAGKVDVL